MNSRFFISAILIVFMFTGISRLHAQITAVQVLDNMYKEYERGVQNINDYTVATNIYTAQYKKTFVNGRPTFKSRIQVKGMEQFGGEAVSSSTMGHGEFFDEEMFNHIKQNARYEGTETIDGTRTHRLFIPELKELTEKGESDQAKNVYFYVDADRWVIRKIKFDVEMQEQPGQIMSPIIRFQDYRNVQGMYMPYTTVMEMEGLDDAISPEDREEARKGMAELKKQLEDMPDQQRKMMENMLRPQIEQLEKMLAGDKFEMVIEVQEVQVNTGLSDDLFN
jgi:hypothetical protein